MSTIVENTKKKPFMRYNSLVVRQLAAKYEVSENFVRHAIKGTRTSDRAGVIQKDYRKKLSEIEIILNK
ncbi:hypothetical protein [Flavobacterium sp.]|uniref:hypothetical protein n=1 Tax=Flavobacterium sp. TaxID=239 RepID=UPI00261CCF95|nr:hypothetical protein [Flavobacterium sp.]MDD3005859.1 hypothetical protein [Flavobacterium sp.]